MHLSLLLSFFLVVLLLVLQNSMILSGLSWEDLLHPLYQKYKNHITWGDQDLLNIIFHYNPGAVAFFFTGFFIPPAVKVANKVNTTLANSAVF